MGRTPVPGQVKTRLGLPGPAAAALYRAFLTDVFSVVDAAARRRPALLEGSGRWFSCALGPAEPLRDAERLTPNGWTTVAQGDGDLGDRMRAAWRAAGARRAVVIGSDLPALPPERLIEALSALEADPESAVFVPVRDGGYGLVGLTRDVPELFSGIRWSSSQVMAETRARAAEIGLRVRELAPHRDVDDPADLAWLREVVAPGSATARALVGLGLDRPAPPG